MPTDNLLWPEDRLPEATGLVATDTGPDTDLAVSMLAAGCTQQHIRQACGFESARAVAAFCRDSEVLRAVAEKTGQAASRVGSRALVRLERILSEEHTDLRATVLAVRTGLEVGGLLKKEPTAPLRTVSELSVPELSALIESTKAELQTRIAEGGQAEGK